MARPLIPEPTMPKFTLPGNSIRFGSKSADNFFLANTARTPFKMRFMIGGKNIEYDLLGLEEGFQFIKQINGEHDQAGVAKERDYVHSLAERGVDDLAICQVEVNKRRRDASESDKRKLNNDLFDQSHPECQSGLGFDRPASDGCYTFSEEVMYDLLRMKFSQCPEERESLLRLRGSGCSFVEDSGRREDYFWGVSSARAGIWHGQNRLGNLLDIIADEFIELEKSRAVVQPIYEFRPAVLEKLKYRDKDGNISSLAGYDPTKTPAPVAPAPAPKKPHNPARKSDFEKRIDAFNAVTDRSWLTHQNVDRLLHDAFVASGIAEDQVNEMTRVGSIDICATDNRFDSIDYILLEAVLKFIGQDPQKPTASIALCSGGQRDPVTGHVSGGAHWTALHLQRVTDPATGLTTIKAFTMDSGGNHAAPAAVDRVLSSISDNHGDIMSILGDGDAQDNITFLRAAQVLQAGNTKLEDAAVPLRCDAQKDGYSCGYHAVFNLVNMASRDDVTVDRDRIVQAGGAVDAQQFIERSKEQLIQIFPAPLQRAVPGIATDPSRVAPKQDPENEVSSIVFDDKLGYVTKLEKLIAIEERLVVAGEITTLSSLQIEKHYGKIINEIVQNLRNSSFEITADSDEAEFTEVVSRIIDNLEDPKISQNPTIILAPLRKFFLNTAFTVENFLQLNDEIEQQFVEPSSEVIWQDRCRELCNFLNHSKTKFPESFAAIRELRAPQTEEDYREISQLLQSEISLEQRKQKIFKDLDLVGLKNVKNTKESREFEIDGTYYALEKDGRGIISVWQNSDDNLVENFSKVSQAKIDHVLHKIESEIISKKISRMTNESDRFAEGVDGSLSFVVKTLIDPNKIEKKSSESSWDRYSPNQIAKEKAERISEENVKAEGGGERWERIRESNKKIEMAKFVTLPKDDTMWKIEGKEFKLVGEIGNGKETKFASEVMRYYFDGCVGSGTEEAKKKYGVLSTVDKPNPMISKVISAVAIFNNQNSR